MRRWRRSAERGVSVAEVNAPLQRLRCALPRPFPGAGVGVIVSTGLAVLATQAEEVARPASVNETGQQERDNARKDRAADAEKELAGELAVALTKSEQANLRENKRGKRSRTT